MSARTIIWYLPCWVRVDIWWWYELTSLSGKSWHGWELTWLRVDIYCVVIDVYSYHHFILALLGTSWHHLWSSWHLLVVRVDMGTSWHGATWHGYELNVTRTDGSHMWYLFTGLFLPMQTGLEIGPVCSSETTNNLWRMSSVLLSLSYQTSAPAWQFLRRT